MMSSSLKIASTQEARQYFDTDRVVVDAVGSDFTDVGAVIAMDYETDVIDAADATKFGIPVFAVTKDAQAINADELKKIFHIIDLENKFDATVNAREIETAVNNYEDSILPPFFKSLKEYVSRGLIQFDCPGHQGGQYYRKHPAGREFYDFFGETVFRADLCNADVALGDLLIHEGPAVAAEKHAARVYNADKTYFVLGGSSNANNTVTSALISNGDLVLFDRNNHKSVYNSALAMAGGRPVYLQTNRNPYGFIGGIYDSDFDEKKIRELAAKVDPERAKWKRPFRLAVIQLGTYDGTIYNAHEVVKRIGHLCDYIEFDSAWVGYEQFIPMMRNSSPLLIDDLGPEDPGILVVQSVHKQQAGFSQTSQIHKKDSHIKGQLRYCDHKHFNNSFNLFMSTSPFYPMYAALDVNAAMQEGEAGRKLWHDLLITTIEARKKLIKAGSMFRPFVPPVVNGKKWEDGDTEDMANNIDYWRFEKGAKWHAYEGYGDNQYYVDPNKFMLTTPGINPETGDYEDFGVPATIVANYLRDHGIIPEKSDLNSILFLMTPAETPAKMNNLITQLLQLQRLIEEDAPLKQVLPSIYAANEERYNGYTIRELCQELHDFYKNNNTFTYQKRLFLREFFPEQGMLPYEARQEFIRNHNKLVPLNKIEGEIALEGALPYPPGVFCVAPGEKWSETAVKYFTILQDGINNFPGFAPEIQGVYFKQEGDKVVAYGEVYDAEVAKNDDRYNN